MVHAGARPRDELSAIVFRPPRATGVIIGGAFATWALVVAAIAFNVAQGAQPEFKTFLAWVVAAAALLLAGLFATWAVNVARLAYIVHPDTLEVRWGWRSILVPIGSIQRLVPGRTLDPPEVSGLNWWGCHVGAADVKRVGYTLFYSTHATPEELLYVVTDGEAYGLTVEDQASFAEAIQARAALAPVDDRGEQRSVGVGPASLPLWQDRAALWTLGAGALLCALACGYVFTSYPGLPDVVELSFPALGGIVRVGNREELLGIAYLAAAIYAGNVIAGTALHAVERAAGLWLFASGALLQGVLLLAALIAISRA
ncbi:MAG: hypothetical protein KatS3mg062_0276 [Tepidiforma sp.]|nr:MAG: hypothetical protein KatS3mg062_0276 [Tepidiforma sp.]